MNKSGSTTYKKENSYNLFLSAATPINDTGLLYGKVGYTGASIKSTLGSASGSQTYGGYSLGLGYKQYVTGSLYGFVEANYYNYGNTTSRNSGFILGVPYTESYTTNANVYNVMAGVGYKF